MELTNREKIEKLREAQEKLFEVIETIEEVFPKDRDVKAYLVDHLRIYASEEHGFMTSDPNLDELIAKIEEGQEEERVAIAKKSAVFKFLGRGKTLLRGRKGESKMSLNDKNEIRAWAVDAVTNLTNERQFELLAVAFKGIENGDLRGDVSDKWKLMGYTIADIPNIYP